MSVLQIVFLVTGFITLTAAMMVALSPKLVHAAVWLILALAGMAVLFITLEAGFLAVVQVAIYIDAIAILIIITVMLTHRVMRPGEAQINPSWILAGVAALVLASAAVESFDQFSGRTHPRRGGRHMRRREPLHD